MTDKYKYILALCLGIVFGGTIVGIYLLTNSTKDESSPAIEIISESTSPKSNFISVDSTDVASKPHCDKLNQYKNDIISEIKSTNFSNVKYQLIDKMEYLEQCGHKWSPAILEKIEIYTQISNRLWNFNRAITKQNKNTLDDSRTRLIQLLDKSSTLESHQKRYIEKQLSLESKELLFKQISESDSIEYYKRSILQEKESTNFINIRNKIDENIQYLAGYSFEFDRETVLRINNYRRTSIAIWNVKKNIRSRINNNEAKRDIEILEALINSTNTLNHDQKEYVLDVLLTADKGWSK